LILGEPPIWPDQPGMTQRPGLAVPAAPVLRRWRPTVRLHLLILALTALLPLWMLAGYTAWRAADAQRASFANDTRDAARNLAFVLEREMVGLRGALTALGSSPALRAGDFATFHAQAIALQSVDGSRIRLTDVAGRVLVDTSVPYGEVPPDATAAAPRTLGATLPDALSGVMEPDRPGASHQVALTLEVQRGPEQEPLFLSIGTDPLRLWLGSLRRAALPPGWIALVADAEGRIVAREPYQAEVIGRQLPVESATRQALASGRFFGWSRGRMRDGTELLTAWHRVGASPWLVLVGLPAAMSDSLMVRALLPVVLLGSALLLLFTVGLTLWADRRIAAPLARMGQLAVAYGQGAPPPSLRRSGLHEIDQAAEALVDATASREVMEAERLDLTARLRMVLESTTDGVVVLDPDWRLLYLNGRARQQLGGDGNALGRKLPEAYPGWAQGAFAHAYRRAMTERTPQRVAAFHPVQGRWISADAYPSPEGLTIFFRDVSAERAAEAALRENESLLKAVLDNVPVGVIVAEAPAGRMILANRRTEEILRRPPTLSRSTASYAEDWEWFHPDGRPLQGPDMPLAQVLASGMPASGEFQARRGDGSLGWVRVSATAVRDGRGQVTGAVAAITDIDAERRAAEQVRESEQRFRTLAETLPQIVWAAQPDGTLEYVNPRLRDFTGLTIGSTREMLPQIVHPEDQRRTERAWRRALKTGESFSAELRLRRTDGGWRWCVARAVPVRAPAEEEAPGEIRRWIGTVTDVTDMVETREALARQVAAHAASREAAVRAAAALAASESRFRRFAEASPDVMWMTDASGHNLEFVSPAFERIWGMPQEATLSNPQLWIDAVHPSDRERVRAARNAAIRGAVFDTEYRILRPDGGLRWIRDVGFPVLDAQGGLSRRGGLARDITAAKAAEARQVLLLGELNHRVKNTLATVHSLALQTARTGIQSEALQHFLTDFQARLMALSRGHDLLTARTWRGATLEDAARTALSPWQALPGQEAAESRIQLGGPAVWLAPKQALGLALALHELATNAAKHGALSRPDGVIDVFWQDSVDGMVDLRWQERNGPPVQAPARRGFGSRLLERGLPAELGPGSSVALNYAADGFAATIRFRPVNGPRAEEERA
jgi:PAS domain S-box-containing protein